jgi:hypothetical protein
MVAAVVHGDGDEFVLDCVSVKKPEVQDHTEQEGRPSRVQTTTMMIDYFFFDR